MLELAPHGSGAKHESERADTSDDVGRRVLRDDVGQLPRLRR